MDHTKEDLVAACFAFIPFLFGDALGDALKQVIPPVAGDQKLLASACMSLRLNKVDPETLLVLVADAGADLPSALRDAYEWSKLTDIEEHFPEQLRNLASELGVAVEASEDR